LLKAGIKLKETWQILSIQPDFAQQRPFLKKQ
jgi:hypothetical protein